jgi:hypothetical protein
MVILIDTLPLCALLKVLSVLYNGINTSVDYFYNSDLLLFIASLHGINDFISWKAKTQIVIFGPNAILQ